MLLFIDTETTGFVDFRKNPDHPSQPDLVQLSLRLTEDDGTPRHSFDAVIKPEGFTIPDKAASIHGISTELADRIGMPRKTALSVYWNFLNAADMFIAHSAEFDEMVMSISLFREKGAPVRFPDGVRRFCTMLAATPVVKAMHQKPRRPDDYKWPKLSECMKHFFDEEFDGHTSDVDVEACKRIFFALKEGGHVYESK